MKRDSDRYPNQHELPHPRIKSVNSFIDTKDIMKARRFRCPSMQTWLLTDATCKARRKWLAKRSTLLAGRKGRRQVSPHGYAETERAKDFEKCLTCKVEVL